MDAYKKYFGKLKSLELKVLKLRRREGEANALYFTYFKDIF